MAKENPVEVWLQQIRGPFLILAVVLVLIGVFAAKHDGFQHWGHAGLLIFGVVLAHIAVNLFNELSDYKTKIDENTNRTPFSGGSGMMQAGKTQPKVVRIVAYVIMGVSALIGVYFISISGWPILVFMLAGFLAIRFYTTHLAKWLLGEFAAGLTLGSLVVIGVYYAMTRTLTFEIIWVSIPPGILTSLLLFLNEFPDAEADEAGGRHHLVIQMGKQKSARVYIAGLGLVYLTILAGPFISALPMLSLIGLLALPLAIKAGTDALKHYDDLPKLIPALGMNVGVVILTDLFLAIAFLF